MLSDDRREDSDLHHWSSEDRLHRINVPTLVINGRYNTVQDFVVEPFVKHIPRVKWVRFEHSSHTPFWEERERYMELVGDFIGYQA
jgi:pimeloyl-ACP methyl ester carboxylesterase